MLPFNMPLSFTKSMSMENRPALLSFIKTFFGLDLGVFFESN